MNVNELRNRFLQRKKLKFSECTERQKKILLIEKPNMWLFYTWDL